MRALLIALCFSAAAPAQEAGVVPQVPVVPPKDLGRSESASGQFTVFGQPLELRGTMASYLERRKMAFARFLGRESAEWSLPVKVRLYPPSATRMGGVLRGVDYIDGIGLRGTVKVGFGRGFQLAELDEALFGTLLAEIVLGGGKLPRTEGEIVPPWAVVGVGEAVAYRERGRPGDVFRAIIDQEKLLGVADVLAGDPASGSPVERAVYRASAGALVLALLGQDDGGERFAFLLEDFRTDGTSPEASREGIRKHFPAFRLAGDSLEKWWMLEMASLAEPEMHEMMTAADTEAALAAALYFPLPEIDTGEERPAEKRGVAEWFRRRGADGRGRGAAVQGQDVRYVPGSEVPWLPVGEFAQLLGRPDVNEVVGYVEHRLILVEMRAFPLLKPVVQGYREVLKTVRGGNLDGVGEALAVLAERRRSILAKTREVSTYLDWFEATQRDERSGAFDVYFRHLLRSGGEAATPGGHAYSRALDAFDPARAQVGKPR